MLASKVILLYRSFWLTIRVSFKVWAIEPSFVDQEPKGTSTLLSSSAFKREVAVASVCSHSSRSDVSRQSRFMSWSPNQRCAQASSQRKCSSSRSCKTPSLSGSLLDCSSRSKTLPPLLWNPRTHWINYLRRLLTLRHSPIPLPLLRPTQSLSRWSDWQSTIYPSPGKMPEKNRTYSTPHSLEAFYTLY
jgi:hypothetical protein